MKFENLKKPLKIASKVGMTVFTFLFGVSMVGGSIAFDNSGALDSVLGGGEIEMIQDPNAANMDKEYYKSSFRTLREVQDNARAYGETIVAEGATLLKNENGALPLSEGAKVNLYSTSSVSPIVSGSGSSGNDSLTIPFIDGMTAAGLEVNEDLYSWYEENFEKYGRKTTASYVGKRFMVGDAKWDEITTDAKNNEAEAAIFMLSRAGGEGRDPSMFSPNADDRKDTPMGNYLKLAETERDVLANLKKLKDDGKIDKIIVLINTANPVECEFIDDEAYGIDSAMWIGCYGSMGAYAVGDLLAGNVNPSGRLSDTFWKYHHKNPVLANAVQHSGAMTQLPADVTQWYSGRRKLEDGVHIVYQEGIYMGYRYTETRYEDTVLGVANNTGFDYNEVVSYPFGYGLSYTNFEYSNFKVKHNPATTEEGKIVEASYDVSVDVKNTGGVAGKEVVQIYLQKPYTDYDKTNAIGKSSVDLVGFGKTEILEPNQVETVTVRVNERDFTSYDAHGKGTYILDEGTYYLTAAKDSHDAVNNILAAKGKTVAGTEGKMTADGNTDLVYDTDKQFDEITYSKSAVTGNPIVNRFDDVDLHRYEGAGDNKTNLKYVSRTDWDGTVKFGIDADNNWLDTNYDVIGTAKMQEDLDAEWSFEVGKGDSQNRGRPSYGKNNGLQLIDLRAYKDGDADVTNDKPIEYDNELWDDLLDQMTFDDYVTLFSDGFRRTLALPSIGKPLTIDHNGAIGPVEQYNVTEKNNFGLAVRKNDPDRNERPVAYPCNGLTASTFNLELALYNGKNKGEICLWAGYSGLYGFGIDIHRSAYGGRNFEYYSEDGFLSGKICAQETLGIRTRGVYVYNKHCFLNDQESYRCGGWTWATEQACREIYLKGFQIAIEEGGAQGVMGGLNSLGMKWTGSHGFMNTVLRGEFGMTGHNVTDSAACYNGEYGRGLFFGNDLPDGGAGNGAKAFWDKVEKGGYEDYEWEMRESAHRILYTVVQSNAMNNYAAGTQIIQHVAWWENAITALRITSGVLLGLFVAGWGALYFLDVKEMIEKKNNK